MRAVVVAQLAELSLPTSEIWCSNPKKQFFEMHPSRFWKKARPVADK